MASGKLLTAYRHAFKAGNINGIDPADTLPLYPVEILMLAQELGYISEPEGHRVMQLAREGVSLFRIRDAVKAQRLAPSP